MYSREGLRRALRLYAVTDRSWLAERPLVSCVADAVAGGATFIQLREKHATFDEAVTLARLLQPICAAAAVPFVINDDVEVAQASDADGVHVGQSDMACVSARALLGPDKIVGVSVGTLEEALAAEAGGADYLGVGAVFGTPTKPDAVDVSLQELKTICAAVNIPVVAIGGLNAETIPSLALGGVDGFAVVSAIFASAAIEDETRTLREIVDKTLSQASKIVTFDRRN